MATTVRTLLPRLSERAEPRAVRALIFLAEKACFVTCSVLQDVLTSREAGSRCGSGWRAPVRWTLPGGQEARGERSCAGSRAAVAAAAAPQEERAEAARRAGDGDDRALHLSRARGRLRGRTVTAAAPLARQLRGCSPANPRPAAGRAMSSQGRARPRLTPAPRCGLSRFRSVHSA